MAHPNSRTLILAGLMLLMTLACGLSASPTSTSNPTLLPTIEPVQFTPEPVEGSATSAPTVEPIVIDDGLSPVSYSLPLVIQNVTDTSAVLFFELSTPAEGVLVYTPLNDPTRQMITPFDQNAARHQIVISGLQPDTEYTVSVGIMGESPTHFLQAGYRGGTWGSVRVKTSEGSDPVRVGIIGDGGFGSNVTAQLAQEMSDNNLNFVIYAGDIVYNMGDNVDGYEAFALKYFLPLAPLLKLMPVYPVVGNHDVEGATRVQGIPFYYTVFPPFPDERFTPSDFERKNQWYAFAYNNIQFVTLDAQVFYNEDGQEAQTTWLKERLADTRFSTSIPIFHVAMFTSGRHTFDGLPIRQAWQSLFEDAHVPLVINGHDHNYEHLKVNGIDYLVSGGASETLYGIQTQLPESIFFAQRTHYVLMEMAPDHLALSAIALGGEMFDQFTVTLGQR